MIWHAAESGTSRRQEAGTVATSKHHLHITISPELHRVISKLYVRVGEEFERRMWLSKEVQDAAKKMGIKKPNRNRR